MINIGKVGKLSYKTLQLLKSRSCDAASLLAEKGEENIMSGPHLIGRTRIHQPKAAKDQVQHNRRELE